MRSISRLTAQTARAWLPALLLGAAPMYAQRPALGPADGVNLVPTDTGRVAAGMSAPDFTLEAFTGPAVTLSQFRGTKTVLLAFYRGHW